jgi:hypothetical protein
LEFWGVGGETLLRSYLRRLSRSFAGLPPFYVTWLKYFAGLAPFYVTWLKCFAGLAPFYVTRLKYFAGLTQPDELKAVKKSSGRWG